MKISNCIVCDEVRIENNGKHILIGVYPHNIQVPQFPHRQLLTMWMQFNTGEAGVVDIEFRVLDEKHAVKVAGGGHVEVEDKSLPATIPIGSFPIEIQAPTKLIFQFRKAGKRWQTVNTLTVEKGQSGVEKEASPPAGP